MTDVTELQGASDGHQPGDGLEGRNAELLSVLARSAEEADLAEEADSVSERPSKPVPESASGVTKGIVYW